MHVGSTGCPSLCAALIYPGSGFPENPQISVKHNQPPPLLHRAGGAYSVQLHKSHCNLCCVIIGFRCLPLGRQRAEQGHRSSVPGQSQIPFSVCYVFLFFFNVSLFSRVHSEFLDLESRSSCEILSRLKMCCTMASRVVAEHLTFRSLSSEVHGFTSPVHARPTQKPESGRSRAPSGGNSTRACARTALPPSVTTNAKE